MRNDIENARVGRDLKTELPQHQVVLTFTNDDEGASFREWWEDYGMVSYCDWYTENVE